MDLIASVPSPFIRPDKIQFAYFSVFHGTCCDDSVRLNSELEEFIRAFELA